MRSESVNQKSEPAKSKPTPVDPRGKLDGQPRPAGPRPEGAAKFLDAVRGTTPSEPPLTPSAKEPLPQAPMPEPKPEPLPRMPQGAEPKVDTSVDRGRVRAATETTEIDTTQITAASIPTPPAGATPDVAAVAAGFAAGEPASVRKSMRVGRDANGAVTVTLDLDTADTNVPLRMTQVDPDTVSVALGRNHGLTSGQIDDLLARLRGAAGETRVVLVPDTRPVTHG